MTNNTVQTAELTVPAGVSMFCQIGTQVSGMVVPASCSLLQAYEGLQAAVVVTTRPSWRAVGTLVQVGHHAGPWTPRELEEFLTDLAVVVAVLGLSFWMVMRSQKGKPKSPDSPESSIEGGRVRAGNDGGCPARNG